ncbi:glycoside hydrolase family 31 protein [Pigmentiphaga soli]|uniref:Glycoside hydrolase family 31 protein n=1 Tax=Pigmentiphaga soli TaxID=1007095 RepID=A0ABP8HCH6_9BURK
MPLRTESSRYQRLESLSLHASDPVSFRFNTDGGRALLVEAHAPGVFRLCIGGPLAEGRAPSPGAARAAALQDLLARAEPVGEASLEQFEADGQAAFRLVQGDHALELRSAPLRLTLHRKGQPVLASAGGDGQAFGVADGGWRVAFDLADGESLHGLGETTQSLDRRGAVIATDDPDARALPLCWSPGGWGVYANTLAPTVHALGAAAAPSGYVLAIGDADLDLFLFVGDPAEILNQYSQITGRAGQPPLWSMGTWLQQPDGGSADELAGTAAKMRELAIPFDAVSLASPVAWDIRTKLALEWDAARFPDPRHMLARFKELDAKVCAPGFPAVLTASPMFADLEDKGWLLTDDSGGAQAFPGIPATGGAAFGLLDLTHRDVWAFWRDKIRQLLDEGVDAVACDAQIHIPDGVSSRSGDDGARLRTLYPILVKRCLFEAAAWNKTPAEGLVWSHDVFATGQRLPLQASTAVPNGWEGLAASIRAALSVGNSGLPSHAHDIGSPDQPRDGLTPELYLRWLAAAVFSSHFRFHAVPGLLPWDFGDEVLGHVRTWMQFRYRLIPYVLGAIEDAARTGLPVQRSMALAFPDDPEAHRHELQYLLGPALLVAPALEPGDKIRVYLPKGEAWWDLNTGWRYEGGTAWTFECGLDRLPVFGREGHMLCLGPAAQHTGEFNSARILDEVWLFGMPVHNPTVMRNKIRVMQMQGSSYAKGLEGLRILPSEGLEVKRRGAEVRISRAR